ncbi:glycoside hydrolase family 18 protein [Silvibacterium sp.]|uniref:glycoside hydrolase family 18 protein n=1 Tax=Silvibacterium sp. TaxID=1964179 RepID=UPI0039E6DBCC
MFQRIVSLAVLAIGLVPFAVAEGPQSTTQVIGYVFPQEQRIQPGDISPTAMTRINFAFTNIKGNRMVLGEPGDAGNFAVLTGLRKQNPALTVLASVGGWGWSGGFSDMALTQESRAGFIESVVEFLAKYDLDGLDIDWEYPAMEGSTKHFRPADTQNYTLLLKELRERFDLEQKKLKRRLYLSIAVGGEQDFIDHTQMAEVQKYVDTVNLMAYDYYEPGDGPITGHHAPLNTNPADPKKISASHSVDLYEHAGVPAEKIVLGLPFYGHAWGGVADKDHGLYQPGKAVPNLYASYGNIVSSMIGKDYTRYWDAKASAPYLYSSDKRIFVSYEDPESLALKCKFALDHHLGGVMFWDYESDPAHTLLNTVDHSMHEGSR